MASPPVPIQPRMAGPQPVQLRAAHPHAARSQLARPGAPPPHVPQRPVVQRVGNGEAFQLPANLLSFGGPGGQPLPGLVRQKMESFFGTSFADVRVHVGVQASSIGALAFAHGSNLYFAPGHYNPHTPQGQKLLGHELTHVVQQRAGRVQNPFGAGIAVVQDRSMETEADRMGERAASHRASVPTPRLGSESPVMQKRHGIVQRHPDIELRELIPLRARLIEAGYRLRNKSEGGLDFIEIVDHNVLIYERAIRDVSLLAPIMRLLTGTLTAYRGIPVWHRLWREAKFGRVVPMGAGPPDFVTANSRFVPFADGLGEARVAAKASRGESNPGQRGGLENMRGFDPDDPDQEIGRVVKVEVSSPHPVCFFNAGELQIEGPVACTTVEIFYNRDTGNFIELQPIIRAL